MKARILLIEDDLPLAGLIQCYLSGQGFLVTIVDNGRESLAVCRESVFDLIISDILLPDTSGFELFPKLRKVTKAPIMFLSALSEDDAHIQGLNLGAQDYLIKPINPKLLVARVKCALYRKLLSEKSKLLTVGSIKLNSVDKSCLVKDRKIELASLEFDLLWVLAKYVGEPVSRSFLFIETVGRDYNGLDRTIDNRIGRLRKRLEHGGSESVFIQTVRNQGYQLCI